MGCFPMSELNCSLFYLIQTSHLWLKEENPEGICPFPFYQHPFYVLTTLHLEIWVRFTYPELTNEFSIQ